jgi:hypothetical protein
MSKSYQYFSIPFDLAPAVQPGCTVWYATWSTTPPDLAPGMPRPFTVGVTSNDLPPGANLLGTSIKDPPAPPPPLTDPSRFQETMAQWLLIHRDADE